MADNWLSSNQTYLIINNTLSYSDAKVAAEALGGTLAIITSQAENDYIYQLLSQSTIINDGISYANDGGGTMYAWIGASDSTTEGLWKWVDGTELEYNYWGSGTDYYGIPFSEPDNFTDPQYAPIGQDYAAISLESWPYGAPFSLGSPGQWNDLNGSNKLSYVVEIPNASATNQAPVANNDTAITTNEDIAYNNINVLANDTDVDSNTLTVTIATALHGSVVINSDYTLNYTPSANYNGADTITYTVSDGELTNEATLEVSVVEVATPTPGDTTPPSINWGNTNLTIDSAENIRIYFSEDIQPGAGAIIIHTLNDVVIDIASITYGSNYIEIDPISNLPLGQYVVSFAPDSILDLSGNDHNYNPVSDVLYDGWGYQITVDTESTANNPPVSSITIPDQAYTVGDIITVNPADYFTDADNDVLSYIVKFADGTTQSWAGYVSSPIAFDYMGTHSITLIATDPSGASAEKSFVVIVTDVYTDSDGVVWTGNRATGIDGSYTNLYTNEVNNRTKEYLFDVNDVLITKSYFNFDTNDANHHWETIQYQDLDSSNAYYDAANNNTEVKKTFKYEASINSISHCDCCRCV